MSHYGIVALSTRLNCENVFRGWIGIHLADSYGGGWEMKSHEFITNSENFPKLDHGYQPRDPEFAAKNKPGHHTDDAAMSQGCFQALLAGRGIVTMQGLRDSWNKIYQQDRIKFTPRAGWGSWERVAETFGDADMTGQWFLERTRQAEKPPGNAPNMRFFPFLMYSTSFQQALHNTVISVIASHPHPLAVLACIAQLIAYEHLIFKLVDPSYIIKVVRDKLENVYESRVVQSILTQDYIYTHRRDPESKSDETHLAEFLEFLGRVDNLSGVYDVKGENVDHMTLFSMGTQYEIEVILTREFAHRFQEQDKINEGCQVVLLYPDDKSHKTQLSQWFKIPAPGESCIIRVKDLPTGDDCNFGKSSNRSLVEVRVNNGGVNNGPDSIFGYDSIFFDVKSVNTTPKGVYAKPLIDQKTGVPGTGLSANAERTAACALYLLKWSGNATVYENLKRCICFGGDTDSLAITVLPVLMITRDRDKCAQDLVFADTNGKGLDWILNKLEGLEYCHDRYKELVKL